MIQGKFDWEKGKFEKKKGKFGSNNDDVVINMATLRQPTFNTSLYLFKTLKKIEKNDKTGQH